MKIIQRSNIIITFFITQHYYLKWIFQFYTKCASIISLSKLLAWATMWNVLPSFSFITDTIYQLTKLLRQVYTTKYIHMWIISYIYKHTHIYIWFIMRNNLHKHTCCRARVYSLEYNIVVIYVIVVLYSLYEKWRETLWPHGWIS